MTTSTVNADGMRTYKINPRDTPGLPRTWAVVEISNDGNVEALGEYKTEDEAKEVLDYLEHGSGVDYFSDWHTWKRHPIDEGEPK
jgi:hypothetical protein